MSGESYDPEIRDWPNEKDDFINSISKYKYTVNFWKTNFEHALT